MLKQYIRQVDFICREMLYKKGLSYLLMVWGGGRDTLFENMALASDQPGQSFDVFGNFTF